jgi:pteridine reductase
VVVHYGQSDTEARLLQTEIEKLGRKACLLSADLADPQQATDLLRSALEFGPLYGLVNNASVFTTLTWDNTRLADWNRTLQINLTAPFLLSQAFALALPPGANGRIVNLLDWRALRPGPDHFAYTISKAALAALTQSMASALAPRVTVNGLALGAILRPSDGAASDGILDRVPAGRWASLDEVDRALLFLLDGPEYITGEIIHVDGGRHLL